MRSPPDGRPIARSRRLGEAAEVMTVGGSSGDPMRLLMAGDSDPAPTTAFKVYLVRVASVQERGGRPDLSWKPVSTFAEMAIPAPRSEVTGACASIYAIAISRLRSESSKPQTEHAAELLAAQRRYAEAAGLPRLRSSLDALTARLEEVQSRPGFLPAESRVGRRLSRQSSVSRHRQ